MRFAEQAVTLLHFVRAMRRDRSQMRWLATVGNWASGQWTGRQSMVNATHLLGLYFPLHRQGGAVGSLDLELLSLVDMVFS